MNPATERAQLLKKIRWMIVAFVIALVLSGATVFPLVQELQWLTRVLGVPENATPQQYSGLPAWFVKVRNALIETDAKYPFLAYGYDWLAFAHLIIALLFIGVYRDPVRNIFILQWAMAACVLIWPLAFICGPMRGIPLGWQIIDCMFGVVGLIPLWLCFQWTKRLEKIAPS